MQREGSRDAIPPLKETARSNEEHAAVSIFGKGCRDVAGDHATIFEQLDLLVANALDAILCGNPDGSIFGFVEHADAIGGKSFFLAEAHSPTRFALNHDAASVCAEPQVTVARHHEGIDCFVGNAVARVYFEGFKAQSIEGNDSCRSCNQQHSILRLRDHADVALRETVFYLPVLFLIFGYLH